MLYFLIRMFVTHKKVLEKFNTKGYKCPKCRASFQHIENLQLHQQLNHTDKTECCKFF